MHHSINLLINQDINVDCFDLAWASPAPPWLPHVPQTGIRKNLPKQVETRFFCSKSGLLQPPLHLHHHLPAPVLLGDALLLLREKAGDKKKQE